MALPCCPSFLLAVPGPPQDDRNIRRFLNVPARIKLYLRTWLRAWQGIDQLPSPSLPPSQARKVVPLHLRPRCLWTRNMKLASNTLKVGRRQPAPQA